MPHASNGLGDPSLYSLQRLALCCKHSFTQDRPGRRALCIIQELTNLVCVRLL